MQQAIAPGTVIAKRYQIQKKIPDTTSNICYLAEDTDQSNRLVVISFPRMELQTLPGFTATFEDACQRLIKARLNGLIKILDHGEYESQPYAVLQYVTHETLGTVLAASKNKSKKMSVEEVLDWASPLAVTLDELHEMDYVHTNVRPDVIFLGQKRQVLLGDFITELATQRLGAFKQAISSLDIADHLAPEYIKSNYNESYDQYLLATIIYEALAGRSHFHNPGSTEAYRRQVATKFPESLLTHRPELVGASRILGKALERNPVKRFDTCREFVNQLGSAQVNPVFKNTDDKPVTVIKKVLDLDETAPAEPIITSIRSNKGLGRKKGLIWLGVLLLGTGAGAYAVNHFGGLGEFKTKLSTAWNEFSEDSAKPPVVVPVQLPGSTPNATSADASGVADENSTSSNEEASQASGESPATQQGQANKEQANKESVNSVAATEGSSGNAESKIADIVNEVKTDIAGSVTGENQSESGSVTDTANATTTTSVQKSVESGDEQIVVASVVDAGSASPGASGVDDLELSKAISLALREGQAEFVNDQGATKNVTTDNPSASVDQIDQAISLALQQAQIDFMQQTSPATSQQDTDSQSEVAAVVNQDPQGQETASTQQQETASTQQSEATTDTNTAVVADDPAATSLDGLVADPTTVSTEENIPIDPSEIEAQNLNEQMLAANRLADERAEALRLEAEEEKRKLEERREARRKAREEALKKAEEEAAQKRQREEAAKKRQEEAALKKEEETAAREQAAAAEAARNEARAKEVVSAPVAKSYDEMQKERARISALKAQKTARINGITKDCVTSGKIHRQVAAGNLPYVKNCLSVGVDPNLTQSNRWTLLHLAALGGYLNMAKLLIAKGADVNAKAANGKTPLDMATEQNKAKLVSYLRSRGGVVTR